MNTTADPQELARRFNENEAVWRTFDLQPLPDPPKRRIGFRTDDE